MHLFPVSHPRFLSPASCLLLMLLTLQRGYALDVDPRGPITCPGMKVVADGEGVRAPGYRFTNDCAKPSPWEGAWIWPGDNQAGAKTAMFRKELFLDQAPASVQAWISADPNYRLFVNGRLVARGPDDIGRDYNGADTGKWFYNHRDLTPFFTKGTNVIAAEVLPVMPFSSVVSRKKPGFLLEARIAMPGGESRIIKTDPSWRGSEASQYPGPFTYDIAKEPRGWRLSGFDDSSWSPCRQVPDLWQPLVPSEIPPRMECAYPVKEIRGLPGDKTFKADGSFKVVFDTVLSGYPSIRVRGGKGAEMIIKDHNEAKVILDGGEQAYDFPAMTEIVPFFTVEFRHVTEPVEVLDVGAYFTSQPLDYRGTFECSDKLLNEIWKTSRWTVQINLQTHHLDSPNHQEPISDPGDYVIEAMVTHNAFAQPWLARQDIRKFAWILKKLNYSNFHTSYSISWMQMLLDYYDHTGDRTLIVEMAPYVEGLLDTYTGWRGKSDLISEAPNYMFMDWVKIAGIPCHHPPAVIGQGYLTAFYVHGLEMGTRIAKIAGNKEDVVRYAKLLEETKAAFNRELWVAEKGLYRDGKPFQSSVKPHKWLPADTEIETFSPHVNILAVLYDIAPKDRQAAIIEKVMAEEPLNTQPWFMHWVFESIDHAGLFMKYGTRQMRRWKILPETKSFREMWNGGDLSHGWCSTPLVQMQRRILGISPAQPGFGTIMIRPQSCDLAWARGRVPTPHGDVAVSWSLKEDRFSMDVDLPKGSSAEVCLPADLFEQPVCTMDGAPSSGAIKGLSGKHSFSVSGKRKSSPSPATTSAP